MGLYHVGQAGLELLTSSDPLTWASQSAEITGVNHLTQPYFYFYPTTFFHNFFFLLRWSLALLPGWSAVA